MSLTHLSFDSESKSIFTFRPKSLWLGIICTLVALSWAGIAGAQNDGPDSAPPLVDEAYSLKADREAFAELRKNIPEEIKKENDEKAFMDNLMSDISQHPSKVRNKFSSILRKKREKFSKDMNKTRETFSKEQKRSREDFTKELADQRKEFSRKKVSSDEKKDFYSDIESRRKDFYASQKEKRDEFEADIRDKRKNFDDYIRSKTDEFNQLHRFYSKRYEENKKALKDQAKQDELQRKKKQLVLDKEYEGIKNKNPINLAPSPEGN